MKSVVTIAVLLHVALNVLAVTDGAQPASSAPAVRSLRQSADMPTTEGDKEWKAHHQHHHHHVKKVKKIAIPVPVEVPQYIPVPVVANRSLGGTVPCTVWELRPEACRANQDADTNKLQNRTTCLV
ncbi:hypothetical protein PR003_g34263 [Phytophthora rubi]|uniref:RxLR effector protein n=1 Tax=Phytophthora rubi TaxID=129364 RepID=A0A6A3H2X7_9STRA|nr:hypothetical protein PR002_g29156 [Phytophthora rubi]KAE8973589.1 hypothetical protein PR001_g26268 [Phytophthora rubi]KAE9260671.1 hypothetical protein PR003_g34263 [Phytophthora rubi]